MRTLLARVRHGGRPTRPIRPGPAPRSRPPSVVLAHGQRLRGKGGCRGSGAETGRRSRAGRRRGDRRMAARRAGGGSRRGARRAARAAARTRHTARALALHLLVAPRLHDASRADRAGPLPARALVPLLLVAAIVADRAARAADPARRLRHRRAARAGRCSSSPSRRASSRSTASCTGRSTATATCRRSRATTSRPRRCVAGALIAAAIALAAHSRDASARFAALVAETPARRIAALALAAAFTVVWLLLAVNSDRSISIAMEGIRDHVEYQMNETWAVLDGRTPLVNFTSQYGSLWPYAIALSLVTLFGKTLLAFTITSATITAVAMLAVFGCCAASRAARVAALLLTCRSSRRASSRSPGAAPSATRSPPTSASSRCATRARTCSHGCSCGGSSARRAPRARRPAVPRRRARRAQQRGVRRRRRSSRRRLRSRGPAPDRSPRALLRLAAGAAAGLLAAYALVALLTLLRAGSCRSSAARRVRARLRGRRLRAAAGAGALGLHLAIYVTYVAAIACGTVRVLDRAQNRPLSGMLVWVRHLRPRRGQLLHGPLAPRLARSRRSPPGRSRLRCLSSTACSASLRARRAAPAPR